MNLADTAAEMTRLSSLIDRGIGELRAQVQKLAESERDYRKARAEAWAITAGEGLLAKEREDAVNAATADVRYLRDLADGTVRAAHEAIRARRAQLSALQTLVSSHRAEAEFARTT